MEKPSIAFDSLPSGRPLQEKIALAAHPPSCHPRRMFGSRENEREGKKNGRKKKNGKTWREKRAESFALKFLLVNSPFTKLGFGIFFLASYFLGK